MLFGSYRPDQYADPDTFNASLESIFEGYELAVVEYVCSPKTGIQRRKTFPPAISEVVEALDGHRDYLARVQAARGQKPVRAATFLPAPPHDQLVAFCAASNPHYARIVAKAQEQERPPLRNGEHDGRVGIWTTLEVVDAAMGRSTGKRIEQQFQPWSAEELSAHYAERGSGHLRNNMFAKEHAASRARYADSLGEGQRS